MQTQTVATSPEAMMRVSAVMSGTPWTRAVATRMRSPGSQSRVVDSDAISRAMAGVIPQRSASGAAVARQHSRDHFPPSRHDDLLAVLRELVE